MWFYKKNTDTFSFSLIMLSLYIHIPFCASKCAYCSFNSFSITQLHDSELRITNYIVALKKEIDHYANILTDKSLKTLYIWWGTPSRIWIVRIIDIIEYIRTKFDFEDLAELSIELNPYPEEEVLNFVQILNKKYEKVSRVRYSFGIQSFDDDVLKMTWRGYNFWSIVEFLRSLIKLKQDNNVFNFDFIAFGKFQISKNGFKQLWHEFKRDFFQKFLASGYVDSISLYTLEGISHFDSAKAGEKSYKKWGDFSPKLEMTCTTPTYHWTDDEIMEEFTILKEIIEDAWFGRYEISNFAVASKVSIHNMVYWNMENYIWLGLSAASFVNTQWLRNNDQLEKTFQHFNISTFQPSGIRRTNTADIKQYLEWTYIDEKEVHVLNESDLLIEEFFLRLRTREGIADFDKFISVLVPNYEWLITNFKKEGLVEYDGSKFRLTDAGMDVSNSIITDLLDKI